MVSVLMQKYPGALPGKWTWAEFEQRWDDRNLAANYDVLTATELPKETLEAREAALAKKQEEQERKRKKS